VSTLNDVLVVYMRAVFQVALLRAARGGLVEEFQQLCEGLGLAICHELGFKLDETPSFEGVSVTLELGEEAEQKFLALKQWLNSLHHRPT